VLGLVVFSECQVRTEEAKAWCAANGNIAYFETSAKNDTGVAQAFEAAARVVKERQPELKIAEPRPIDLGAKNSSCCNI
jgi:Ras-related protein Rab-7A